MSTGSNFDAADALALRDGKLPLRPPEAESGGIPDLVFLQPQSPLPVVRTRPLSCAAHDIMSRISRRSIQNIS